MNLEEMRARLRRDLRDEDNTALRWTDVELDRHLEHAVRDFSEALPLEARATLAVTPGVREIDIAGLDGLVMIEAVEYPAGRYPPCYQRFNVWADKLTLLGESGPDGGNCCIYYGRTYSLGTVASIPEIYADLICAGAGGYALAAWAVYAVNRVNTGGSETPENMGRWGQEKLQAFKTELRRLGRCNKVRVRQLYRPFLAGQAQTGDRGL